jgi:putative thioredoxin
MDATTVFDVDQVAFEERVVERSRELPVVVDFWAEWCGPCRALSPALEAAANVRQGEVELAKVDVDRNQALAAGFGVQGIPAVKAFRDGRVVDEFTGALPPDRVEAFFDRLVPSEADRLIESGDEQALRRALDLDPGHAGAAGRLARILLERGDAAEALAVAERFPQDYLAAGLAARARLTLGEDGSGDGKSPPGEGALEAAFGAWDAGDHARALEGLQEAFQAASDDERRDLVRQVMVAIFTELGPGDELAREHRRRLSAALH